MKLSDLTVEYRDKEYRILGSIPTDHIDLEYNGEHNNVGAWSLVLPSDLPVTAKLNTPGAGIVVSVLGNTLFSGPVDVPEFAATPEDRTGSITFKGVTDTVHLAERLAYPTPSTADVEQQTTAYDVRTGPAETLIHDYVRVNLGPDAPSERRLLPLIMGDNGQRGFTIKKSARFAHLGNLLAELAGPSGIGFRIVQRGNKRLVFETYEIKNQTKAIRFSVKDGTLAGQRASYAPPGVTRAIVAGGGEAEDRLFMERTSTESNAAETEWGRRMEVFIDQRQTSDLLELQQAGDEALADSGFTSYNVQAVPNDDELRRFGTDWYLGDLITINMEFDPFPEEMEATVTGVVLKADSDGVRVGMTLGDPRYWRTEAVTPKEAATLDKRISVLERAEPPTPTPPYVPTMGSGSWTSTSALNVQPATWTVVTGWGSTTRYGSMQVTGSVVTNPGSAPPNGTAIAGQVQVVEGGLFTINASVTWSSNSTGRRLVAVCINGNEVRRNDLGASTYQMTQQVVHTMPLVPGDVVSVQVYQSGVTGGLPLSNNTGHTFQVIRH